VKSSTTTSSVITTPISGGGILQDMVPNRYQNGTKGVPPGGIEEGIIGGTGVGGGLGGVGIGGMGGIGSIGLGLGLGGQIGHSDLGMSKKRKIEIGKEKALDDFINSGIVVLHKGEKVLKTYFRLVFIDFLHSQKNSYLFTLPQLDEVIRRLYPQLQKAIEKEYYFNVKLNPRT